MHVSAMSRLHTVILQFNIKIYKHSLLSKLNVTLQVSRSTENCLLNKYNLIILDIFEKQLNKFKRKVETLPWQ